LVLRRCIFKTIAKKSYVFSRSNMYVESKNVCKLKKLEAKRLRKVALRK